MMTCQKCGSPYQITKIDVNRTDKAREYKLRCSDDKCGNMTKMVVGKAD